MFNQVTPGRFQVLALGFPNLPVVLTLYAETTQVQAAFLVSTVNSSHMDCLLFLQACQTLSNHRPVHKLFSLPPCLLATLSLVVSAYFSLRVTSLWRLTLKHLTVSSLLLLSMQCILTIYLCIYYNLYIIFSLFCYNRLLYSKIIRVTM